MKMTPIRNDADLQRALRRQKELLESPSADDGDIEVLAVLIADYERKNLNIDAPSPHEAIRFRMAQMSLRSRDLEPILGSRSKVSEILSGKRPLSLEMVRDLNRLYDIPLEALVSRATSPKEEASQLSHAVVQKLAGLGIGFSESRMDEFLRRAFGATYLPALHRKTRTPRANERTDETALLYWQAAVLIKAQKHAVRRKFERDNLSNESLRELASLSVESEGVAKAAKLLKDWGIALVYLPSFPGTYLDGAAMLASDGTPVIGVTGRHNRVDNFWFTLLHEACHLTLHLDFLDPGRNAFFDDLDLRSEDKQEGEADTLARNVLVPGKCLRRIEWSEHCSAEDLDEVASCAGVHQSIVAGRWQRDHGNYRKFSQLIERGSVRAALERLDS